MVMKSWKKVEAGWSHVLDAFGCNKATVTTDGADGPLGVCLLMKPSKQKILLLLPVIHNTY